MTQRDDDTLAERFATSRAQDEASTPHFERVVRGRSRATSRGWSGAAFACGAVALLVVAIVRVRTQSIERTPPLIAFTAGELRVPTDFLLDQAASLRADAMPTIGTVDWSPLSNDNALSNSATRRRN